MNQQGGGGGGRGGGRGGGVRKRVAAGPLGDVKLQIGRLKRLLAEVRQRRQALDR